jgi:predicted RNA-binding Zn-ribbon protein involved in translation (DUF1610 family)
LTTKKPKFICPECNEAFEYPKTLGSHRRLSHGIAGTSESAVRAQKLKALAPPEGPYRCADCDFVSTAKAGLTIHRKAMHGAASESKTAVAIRTSDPLQCPECGFYAAVPGGLALHRLKQHGVVSDRRSTELKRLQRVEAKKRGLPIEPAQTVTAVAVAVTSNGHHPKESHFVGNGIPEGTLALTLGRFQELCFSVAKEHDLPPRSFAAELARLIYATTLR